MRAFFLLVACSCPPALTETLVLESHKQIIETTKNGIDRQINGFDAQGRLRLSINKFLPYERPASYMVAIRAADEETWRAQSISKERFDALSQDLLSTKIHHFFRYFFKACHAVVVTGEGPLISSTSRLCPPEAQVNPFMPPI